MGVPLFSEISTALFSAHALFRKIVIDDVRSSRYSVNGIQMENGECISYGSVEEGRLYVALHGVPAMSITVDTGGQVRVLEIADFRMPVLGENTEPYVRLFTIQNSAPNCTSMKILTTNKAGDKSIGFNVVYADNLSHLFTERTLDIYKGRLTPYRYKSSRVGKHGLHYWLSEAEVMHGDDASTPYGKQDDLM